MTGLGLKLCLWVMLGGALGAVSRYLITQVFDQYLVKTSLSIGMLTCNIVGCFLFGWVSAWLSTKNQDAGEASIAFLTAFLISGFLASFTTFSSWIAESNKIGNIELLSLLKMAGYFILSVLLGLSFLVLGNKCYLWFK